LSVIEEKPKKSKTDALVERYTGVKCSDRASPLNKRTSHNSVGAKKTKTVNKPTQLKKNPDSLWGQMRFFSPTAAKNNQSLSNSKLELNLSTIRSQKSNSVIFGKNFIDKNKKEAYRKILTNRSLDKKLNSSVESS